MFRRFASLMLALLAAAPATAQTAAENQAINAALPADQAAMKAHVMFLASDEMRGRDAGSHEFDIAAQYVASQFYAAGLRPMGTAGSYLQKVPLIRYKPADKGAMTITRKGAPLVLSFGEDFVPAGNPSAPNFTLTAPVVFVGYGIEGLGRDDYKGVNVKGKIVAFFTGAPSSFPSEERATFGKVDTKAAIAARKGAVGYLTLEKPSGVSFSYAAGSYDRVRYTWAEADGTGHIPSPGTPALGSLSKAGAARLFDGAKGKWADVFRRADDDAAVFRAEELPGMLTVTLKTANVPVPSYNVAAILPGSDPALKDEVVILSAHLDHIGVGTPDAKGDGIYNGAMDNAVGIASLIEEAKRFRDSGKAPRRSILFLAVTAEEKGLIGADYFAWNPTVPKGNIVADVNLDMPIINYRFEDILPFGASHSTIGDIAAKAAGEIGVTVSADARPEEAFFVRSDHYRFVQQGIPSIFLWPGEKGPGKAAVDAFLDNHYHQPSDGLVQDPPIDWESGVRFVDVNYRIARAIADAEQKPMWKKGDFFGLMFGGPMEK
jgi:hypothetical protein